MSWHYYIIRVVLTYIQRCEKISDVTKTDQSRDLKLTSSLQQYSSSIGFPINRSSLIKLWIAQPSHTHTYTRNSYECYRTNSICPAIQEQGAHESFNNGECRERYVKPKARARLFHEGAEPRATIAIHARSGAQVWGFFSYEQLKLPKEPI